MPKREKDPTLDSKRFCVSTSLCLFACQSKKHTFDLKLGSNVFASCEINSTVFGEHCQNSACPGIHKGM